MFLREIKTKGRVYLNIVENYREKGKIKQRCIASLGRKDKLQNSEQLKNIVDSLMSYCKTNKTYFDISTIQEKQRKIWGAPVVIRKIWNSFELDGLFSKIIKASKIKFDFFSCVFLMVLDRLCSPKSKKKSYEQQNKYYGIREVKLQHLYRALDILSYRKEEIEEYLFDKNKSLFNMQVDVVFYDVTTLYFESVISDTIRDFGFSKDQKINEVQIVLGLLIDQEGIPIGFDIFSGNTFEGKTIRIILEKLSNRFQIKRVIFVGDQAILSKDNLCFIEEMGYEYVVGWWIKNKSDCIRKKILDSTGYIKVKTNDADEIFRYKEIRMSDDRRIICGYSLKRANKDKEDRERLIKKAEKILERGLSIISRRGSLRYIKIKGVSSNKIDEDRIEEDEKWDGYYGVETNCKNISGQEVLEIYHKLWKIEEAFRILKSHFEARPIFHWTEKRIKGHLVLCFIAFLLERILETELKKNNIEYSPTKIREALNSLQASLLEIEGQRFYIRSPIEGLANDILRIFRIKIPGRITTLDNFFM